MTLLEFAKSISQTVHIECLPNGDCIASFGKECQLIILEGLKRTYVGAPHGRGACIRDACVQFCARLSLGDKRWIKFHQEFGKIKTFEITTINLGDL